MIKLRTGQTVYRFGDGYRVVQRVVRREVVLECLSSGKQSTHSDDDLAGEAAAGALTQAGAARRRLLASVLLGIPHAPMGVPRTQRWSQEARRLRYMQQLIARHSFDRPWPALWHDVCHISRELAEEQLPHASTVRRWRALYRAARRFARSVLGDARTCARASGHVVARDAWDKPQLRVVPREV